MPTLKSAVAATLAAALAAATFLPAGEKTGKEKAEILNDHSGLSPLWIYDDIPAGIARARAEGKPLFIVFR